jgi:hypothetical protein
MVRLGIEFLELELNSYSNYEFRGKKLCLGVEFLDYKILFLMIRNDWKFEKLCIMIGIVKSYVK